MSVWDIEWTLFDNLRTAKQMSETNYAKRYFDVCGDYEVDSDCFYEMAWMGMAAVFPDWTNYFNEEIEAETIVFFDPLIEEFCRLCREYEAKKKIQPDQNTFWGSFQQAMWQAFDFDPYCYDYDIRCYGGSHGRPRLVLLMGMEFNALQYVPTGLIEVKDALVASIEAIKQELKPKKKRAQRKTPRPVVNAEWKEAA